MKKNRLLGIVALICLMVTVIWLALFTYDVAARGAVETAEQAVASVADLGALQILTYVNATLVTVSATMLFGELYVLCRDEAPLWAAMGLVFVPIYGLLNLFAYLSQLTIVPRLAALRPASDLLVAQMVQAWPGSVVNVLNNLGYAVLGVPSIMFGSLLARRRSLRCAGLLLALNGVACIVGLVGIAAGSELLSLGSIVGGAVFLVALGPLSVGLLREP